MLVGFLQSLNWVSALSPQARALSSPLGSAWKQNLPCPSRPGVGGSEQQGEWWRVEGWASPGGLFLLFSQWRAELHWEDFQRGGAAGILCVREFILPKLPTGMALLKAHSASQAAAAGLSLTPGRAPA